MTEKELQEIEERASRATRGPWTDEISDRYHPWGPAVVRDSEEDLVAQGTGYRPVSEQVNMNFIAHAREDVPALIAEIRRLQEENAHHWQQRRLLRSQVENACASLNDLQRRHLSQGR